MTATPTPREAVAMSLEASRLCARPWRELPEGVRAAERRRADAILAALRDAGFAVVPREPTEAMEQAPFTLWRNICCDECGHRWQSGTSMRDARHIYRAMLAAAEAGDAT